MKILLIVSLALTAAWAHAENALYRITFKDGPGFQVISGQTVSIFGLPEPARNAIRRSRNRPIAAADYISGTVIQTSQPQAAVQEIVRQISDQTSLSLGTFSNSITTAAKPSVILMAAGENSVWNFCLTEKQTDTYVLTISYLIDEKISP